MVRVKQLRCGRLPDVATLLDLLQSGFSFSIAFCFRRDRYAWSLSSLLSFLCNRFRRTVGCIACCGA